MSVLKKIDSKELATRKQQAESNFRTTINEYNTHAFTDPKTQRPIGAFVKGAIEPILCAGPLDILPNYIAKTALGYKLNAQLGVMGVTSFTIYMDRPEADIKADLIGVFEKVVADYQTEIDDYNNEILAKEIDAQIQRELRQEEQALVEAAQARKDRITAEVKSALGAK